MSVLKELKEKIINKLEAKLPSHLTYHSVDHTLYVYEKAIYIGQKEKVSKKEMELIKIAALYHDVGFIKSPNEHEKTSCKILKKDLKNTKYTEKDITKICGMIMATKIPQNPQNKLEQIIADADLEYLATNKFKKIGNQLFEELKHFNKNFTKKQWDNLQISFISNHKYHTKYCRQYKEKYKRKNLESLIKRTK